VETHAARITLELKQGYQFQVQFDQPGAPPLLMDEPPPLGEGHGPNAARVLVAAVANCLGASLLFCLRRSRVDVSGLTLTADVAFARNERGRMRIGSIAVAIHPEVAAADRERMSRCLELFEDFCLVTGSVRSGIDVQVSVEPVAP
jgi:organic hydroperoxide reductase OsmC/OhrA